MQWKKLFNVLEEFEVPQKLVNLEIVTLQRTMTKVKMEAELSEEFLFRTELGQGDFVI